MNIVNDISKLNGVEFVLLQRGIVKQFIIWQPYAHTKVEMAKGKPIELAYKVGGLIPPPKMYDKPLTLTLQMCIANWDGQGIDPNDYKTLKDYLTDLNAIIVL